MILFLRSESNFFIFDHADRKNLQYFAETKKQWAKFCIVAKYIKCIRKSLKVEKMSREKLVIFALDPKLDWATMTLDLTSAPKFLWSVVHFDK